jgi:predicted nucleic acid-binding protein
VKVYVLDAHALMCYFEQEEGSDRVADVFAEVAERGEKALLTAVNAGEVYYSVLREYGIKKAEEVERSIGQLPIDVTAVDFTLAKIAGHYKSQKKMSYADCFAAALAKQRHGIVVTGDPEFEQVEGDVKILWI